MDLLSFRPIQANVRLSWHLDGNPRSQNQPKLRWAVACKNQTKKSRKQVKIGKKNANLLQNDQVTGSSERVVEFENGDGILSTGDVDNPKTAITIPSRRAVLQACTVTSGSIALLGVLIRQICHVAPLQGWSAISCSADITFGFEPWHLGLVAGSLILVTSSRLLLLKIWPDFADSSSAANQQVLTSLEPLDYVIVALLPGISEELLFRGGLLPLIGTNFTGIFIVSALFGILHIGSGRNYSFAIWATFVGLIYGYITTLSGSVTVPMASHALNNLAGAMLWRYLSNASR